MKPLAPVLMALFLLAWPATAQTTNPDEHVKVIEANRALAAQRALLANRTRVIGDQDEPLSSNVTIRLHGALNAKSEVDVSLTGTGPQYEATQTVAQNEVELMCYYTVSELEQGYRVAYRVTAQPVSDKSTRSKSASISGTILCQSGKAVTILQNGDQALRLTLTEQPESDSGDSR